MSEIEDRLRRDLPLLADELLARRLDQAAVQTMRRRRLAVVAAAAAVTAVALVSVNLIGRHATTEVRTGSPEQGSSSPLDLGSWSPLPAAPITSRSGPLIGLIDGSVVFEGGSTTSGGALTAYSDAAAYDPSARKWSTLPAAAFGHPKSQGVAIGKAIFAEAKGRVFRIDAATGDTKVLPELPIGLETVVGIAAVQTELWVVGIGPSPDGSQHFVATTSSNNEWASPIMFGSLDLDEGGSPHTVVSDSARVIVDAGTDHGAIFDTRISTWQAIEAPPVKGSITAAIAAATSAGIASLVQYDGDGGADEVAIALTDGRKWSILAGTIELPTGTSLTQLSLVPAGPRLFVLGSGAPMLVDLQSGRSHRQDNAPVDDTDGMVGIWTGSEVVVWGGEGSGNRGAIWRPSDPEPASRRSGIVCIPPAAVAPSQGLVGVPIEFAMSGGVRSGFSLGPILTRMVASPSSEHDLTLIVAEVHSSDGTAAGFGVWLSADAIASFVGDSGAQQSWAKAPWKLPRSTHLSSVNDVARSTTVWTEIDDSFDEGELVDAAQSCVTR